MNYKIKIDDIEIFVEKKKIKNMYIKIMPSDGQVKITAPLAAKDQEIKELAFSKINWIKKHKKRIANKRDAQKYKYISGEIHHFLGVDFELEVVFSSRGNNISIKEDKIILVTREGSTPEQREAIFNNWYKEQIKKKIPILLEKWAPVVGKSPNECGVRQMKSRWGTCYINEKRIWLNLDLAKKPYECLEYVMVHELVHLHVRHHNQEFKNYMNQFYPKWKEVKKLLESF